jgi:hypothetical protein
MHYTEGAYLGLIATFYTNVRPDPSRYCFLWYFLKSDVTHHHYSLADYSNYLVWLNSLCSCDTHP